MSDCPVVYFCIKLVGSCDMQALWLKPVSGVARHAASGGSAVLIGTFSGILIFCLLVVILLCLRSVGSHDWDESDTNSNQPFLKFVSFSFLISK